MSDGLALYNEIEPFAADWLEQLIADGLICPGQVDRRDIRYIRPRDLDGVTQFHAFAGIGGWSYALRLAGWPDDRPVWTGSCPCQPFSTAGRGGGFADERHLWPAFFHLISECRPATVFGEQVASKDGLGWLDLVQSDLEGAGYACGAADLCAAGIGAPHIRQRLWWVARDMADAAELGWGTQPIRPTGADWRSSAQPRRLRDAGVMADGRSEGRRQVGSEHVRCGGGGGAQRLDERPLHGGDVELADGISAGLEGSDNRSMGDECETAERSSAARALGDATCREQWRSRQPSEGIRREFSAGGHGPWDDLEWLPCRDGKARPTQRRLQSLADGLWPSMVDSGSPYLEPLAKGQTNRAGMLRGAGNAIPPHVAAEFVRACL